MSIVDFFNPYNNIHLMAYRYLCDTGTWPEGFVPKGVEFGATWQVGIANKLAGAWLKFRLREANSD